MVAKINTGSSLFGALSYNQEKLDTDEAKILYSNRIMQHPHGDYNMYLNLKSFEPYLMANNKTEKPVLHISLNPHPDDKLTDEQMTDIAQEYMDKMGYGDQPYIVYKHEDLDRHHLHMVSVNVDETGKKLNSNYDYKRSKDITRELEKKYNLLPAEKKVAVEKLELKRVNPKAGDIKKQVSNTTKALMKIYHFQSINEYRALLSVYGLTVEEVKGEAKGKAYHGLVYSVLDKKGNKVGNPFKSSLLGKDVGVSALNKRIAYSKKQLKDNPPYQKAKEMVTSILANQPSRKQFEQDLLQNGISVLFRENADKRIYGVTFIDHESKSVFNGSKLGKEFSANAFQDLFNGNGKDQSFENKSFDDFTEQHDNAVDAMAGLFSMEQHGDNYEEIAFANRMKRKKRTKGRRL